MVARTGAASTAAPTLDVDHRRPRCSASSRSQQSVWMSHGDSVTERARRLHGHRLVRRRPGGGLRGRRPRARRGAVPPRGAAHPARPGGARALPVRRRRRSADLDDGQHHRGAGRARSGPRSATGRAICGLSGGVDSAVAAALVQRAIGDRLTCVFVDHGLLRAGEAEQVERDFVAATGVDLHRRRRRRPVPRARWPASPTPRRSARSSAASSSGSSRRPRATSSATRRRTARRSTSWCRARSTPTSSSPAAAPARRTSSATTTSAACPTTCSSRWSSRCARCSRTRSARSARELGPARGDRLAPAVPRPRPRHPHHRRGHPGAARRPAPGRRDRPRGADRRRPGPRDLAVPGGAAGRRPLGRRAGRRPHLRPPDRAAAGVQRGRHDRRLDPAALRPAGADLDPHHQRGAPRSTAWCSTSPASRRAPSSGSSEGPAAPTLAELGAGPCSGPFHRPLRRRTLRSSPASRRTPRRSAPPRADRCPGHPEGERYAARSTTARAVKNSPATSETLSTRRRAAGGVLDRQRVHLLPAVAQRRVLPRRRRRRELAVVSHGPPPRCRCRRRC